MKVTTKSQKQPQKSLVKKKKILMLRMIDEKEIYKLLSVKDHFT